MLSSSRSPAGSNGSMIGVVRAPEVLVDVVAGIVVRIDVALADQKRCFLVQPGTVAEGEGKDVVLQHVGRHDLHALLGAELVQGIDARIAFSEIGKKTCHE